MEEVDTDGEHWAAPFFSACRARFDTPTGKTILAWSMLRGRERTPLHVHRQYSEKSE